MKQYDYIITGGGCAGLSLLMHMMSSANFLNKKILLIEKDEQKSNDRTWCFWEKQAGIFDSIVYKHWDTLQFNTEQFSRQYAMFPYRYKMIRGADFYQYCSQVIKKIPFLEIHYASADSIGTENNKGFVIVNGEKMYADYVFNSIPPAKPALKKNEFYLLQHFKGWVIETSDSAFDPSIATLMDFRVDQSKGTAFVYVMPFNKNKALVEYTLFSENLLARDDYDAGLKKYIAAHLSKGSYIIREEEFGVIPMTNHAHKLQEGKVVNIGTAGGQTKASTGYTFNFIQKQSAAIVAGLEKGGLTLSPNGNGKFHFYDSVLLNVLATGKMTGERIFSDMFRKNCAQDILSFLDNESSLKTDLKLILSLPARPFLKAAIQQIF